MCNKIKYPTKKAARKSKGSITRFAGYMRVYLCPECKVFHLTTKRKGGMDIYSKKSYGSKKRTSMERHCRKDYMASLEVA